MKNCDFSSKIANFSKILPFGSLFAVPGPGLGLEKSQQVRYGGCKIQPGEKTPTNAVKKNVLWEPVGQELHFYFCMFVSFPHIYISWWTHSSLPNKFLFEDPHLTAYSLHQIHWTYNQEYKKRNNGGYLRKLNINCKILLGMNPSQEFS